MNRLPAALIGTCLFLAAGWDANATVIDVTAALSTATDAYGSGLVRFSQTSLQPAGTGIFGTFVEFGGGQSKKTEKGYNTTANNVFDNKNSDNFNHEISVGSVGFMTESGAQYMRFALDIDEQGNPNSALTIDELQLFISTVPNQSVTTFTAAGLVNLNNATLVYRLDGGIDDQIHLDANAAKGPGSGAADMYMDIPVGLYQAAFAAGGFNTVASQNAAYIYLYTAASNVDAGFEEWGARIGTPLQPAKVPEPRSLFLAGLGLLAIARLRMRKTAR